jgi:outer membrane putative beta-barrel porin/alpha-amylase
VGEIPHALRGGDVVRFRAYGPAILIALLVTCPATAVRGQEGEVDPDRPDFTNSARTVPRGGVQIEAGVEYSRTSAAGRPAERRLLADLLGRAGLGERLELRLGLQPVVRLRGADDDTGIGDGTVALKYRFLDGTSPWPALGVQPFVKLPIASEPIGSDRPDFGAVALASFDLPAGFSLDVNAGMAAIGQSRPNGYVLQALTSASLSVEIGSVSPFVEIFYASRGERDGRDRVGVDAGLVYRLTKRVALDAAIETSLVGAGPDWAVRAGVSVRFGK